MNRYVKTIFLYSGCVLIGLAGMFLLNRSTTTNKLHGIHLPFGWEERLRYSIFDCEPDCYYLGIPFTILQNDLEAGGWHQNSAAAWLDGATGVAFGLGAAIVISRKQKN